jgi:Skp family chaperone for outer membrane proteins
MNRNVLTTVVAVVAAFGVGLTWSYLTSGTKGGVAIVDLDEVARRLGREAEMSQSIQSAAGALNQRLTAVQKDAEGKLKAIQAELGTDPNPEEAQQFVRQARSAQIQFNQLKQQAQQQLGNHRRQLVSQFRQETQPVAAKVAKQKGFTTVVTRNDAVVFSYDDAVDITDDVIALMSAEAPARPAPKPAPKQQTKPSEKPAEQTAERRSGETETK